MSAEASAAHVYAPREFHDEELEAVLVNLFAGLERVHLHDPESCAERLRPYLLVSSEDSSAPADSAGELTLTRRATATGSGSVSEDLYPRLLALASAEEGTVEDSPSIDQARMEALRRLGLSPSRDRPTAALTHDVDLVHRWTVSSLRWWTWHGRGEAGSRMSHLRGMLRHAYELLPGRAGEAEIVPWYRLECDLGARSTWFFQGDRAHRRDPRNGWYSWDEKLDVGSRRLPLRDFIAGLPEQGFEVGPHIGLHAHDDEERYLEEVSALSALVDQPVTTRHHWRAVDPAGSLRSMEAAGLRYDLNPGLRGFDLGTARPFRRYDPVRRRLSRIVALPTLITDDVLLKPERGGLGEDAAEAVMERILGAAGEVGGAFAISFHPDSYPWLDKLALYGRLIATLREMGIEVTTASRAAASVRFPEVVVERAR